MSKKRGTFIVIEGLDKSGKSTQSQALLKRLEQANVSAKLIKFPDRTTPIGKMIDAYLKSETELDDHVIHLLFSANRWELASSIVKSLNEGTTVICDRYAFSGIAFSAAKVRPHSKPTDASSTSALVPVLTYDWCRAPDTSLPAPDLTFFLDVSPTKAEQRGGYGSERYEKKETQERVRLVFDRIAEEVEGSGVGKWVVLDADLDKGEVEQSVWDEVKVFVERGGVDGPVKELWDKMREGEMAEALYI